ncbi:MAG: hypothetical protein MHM6MM_000664 [Cercozoa sp. M6MM]
MQWAGRVFGPFGWLVEALQTQLPHPLSLLRLTADVDRIGLANGYFSESLNADGSIPFIPVEKSIVETWEYPQLAELLVYTPLAVLFWSIAHILSDKIIGAVASFLLKLRKVSTISKLPASFAALSPQTVEKTLGVELELLEKQGSTLPKKSRVRELAKKLCVSVEDCGVWFRHRRQEKRHAMKVAKFVESAFRFWAYGSLWYFNCQLLLNSDYFADTSRNWLSWPMQEVTVSQKLFYILQCALNVHLLVWHLLYDERKKDFVVMLVHHVVTISLISFSYAFNYLRIGIWVTFCHDVTDVLMEVAKLHKYLGFASAANVIFALFTVSWLVFRLFLFPFRAIASIVTDYATLQGGEMSVFQYGFVSFLLILQCMHIYWFVLIMRIVVTTIVTGEAEDNRTDDGDDADEKADFQEDAEPVVDQLPDKKND